MINGYIDKDLLEFEEYLTVDRSHWLLTAIEFLYLWNNKKI